jgi:hypothetical protein
LQEFDSSCEEMFAHECRIRDYYAARMGEFRPLERLLKTESGFAGSRVRADMRTVDRTNQLRVWEFKIRASYAGLGQILAYVAQAEMETRFERSVQGVLAAFSFQDEIRTAVRVRHLGIELVELPLKLRLAGRVPAPVSFVPVPDIPSLVHLQPAQGDSQ